MVSHGFALVFYTLVPSRPRLFLVIAPMIARITSVAQQVQTIKHIMVTLMLHTSQATSQGRTSCPIVAKEREDLLFEFLNKGWSHC